MGSLQTSGSTQGVYVNAQPFTAYPIRITVAFRRSSNPSAAEYLVFVGDKDVSNKWLEIQILADGTVQGRDRQTGRTAITANTIDTSGTNIATLILDEGGGGGVPRARVKLNGGSAASNEGAATINVTQYDRLALGHAADSTPSNYFAGLMSDLTLDDNNDDFADHDDRWNSGTPQTSTDATATPDHQWTLDGSGTLAITDTQFDDSGSLADGSYDFTTLVGSPTWSSTDLFSTPDPGTSEVGAFVSATATGPRLVRFLFAKPSAGTYNWNVAFTEDSADRPTFSITRPTPSGGTVVHSATVKEIESVSVNGSGQLEVDVFISEPIRNGDTFTVTVAQGWYTDGDADVTGAATDSAGVNSVGAGFANSKAIARWLTVPYQVFTGASTLEMAAFHYHGIGSVVFKEGANTLGTATDLDDPDTWTTASDGLPVISQAIAAASYSDGAVTFDFEAVPNVGVADSRRLTVSDSRATTLTLYANSGSTLTTATIYVDATSGDDTTGDGSSGNPYQTIVKAVQIAKAGSDDIVHIRLSNEAHTLGADDIGTVVNNGPWWILTTWDGTATNRATTILNLDDYSLGIRRLAYHHVSIRLNKTGGNELSCQGTFTGDTAQWLHNCRLYGDGYLGVEDGATWWRTTEIDFIYATSCTLDDVPFEGWTAFDLVRDCSGGQYQEDVAKDAACIWGLDVLTAEAYPASGQHPDLLQWGGGADNPGDVNVIWGLIRGLNVKGQQLFSDKGVENVAIVGVLGVQTTEEQYLSQFGKEGDGGGSPLDRTCKHILVLHCSLPNSNISLRHGTTDTDVFHDIAIRGVVAKDIGAPTTTGSDDFSVDIRDCHGIDDSAGAARYLNGTNSTGAAGFNDGSTTDYDANATDYTLASGSAIRGVLSDRWFPFYRTGQEVPATGGNIGSEYIALALLTPPDTGTITDATPELTWEGGVAPYIVQINEESIGEENWADPTYEATGIATTSHVVTVTLPPGLYYCRVVDANGTASEVWEFTVESSGPSAGRTTRTTRTSRRVI